MPLPLIVAAGAAVVGGALQYMGANKAAKAQDAANKQAAQQQQQYLDYLKSLNYPEADAIAEAQAKYPIDFSIYDKAALDKIKVGDTSMKDVIESPEFKSQQEDMARYEDISREKGMDAQARAAFEQANMEAATQARAQQEALKQTMARRGLAGSGMELAMAQQAAQSGADTSRMAGLQQSAAAQQRALQALAAKGNLAQGMVSTRSAAAQAQDAINRFNVGNQLENQRALENAKLQSEMAQKQVLQNQPIDALKFKQQMVSPIGSTTASMADTTRQQGAVKGQREAAGYQAGAQVLSTLGNAYGSYAAGEQTKADQAAAQEADRRWQEEMYARYGRTPK